jgi:hypothetical protein
MRLSFSQLERARKNPARFGANFSGSAYFNSNNFRTYLLAAINQFHRGESKAQVLHFFEDKCRARLSTGRHFQAKLTHYLTVLANYCDGFPAQGSQFVESNKSVALALGSHSLSGKIDRFDLQLPIGYRGISAQLYKIDWQAELRWPLIQDAIARELNCPSGEVEVGIFCFEDGAYEYKKYTNDEIAAAKDEAQRILTTVAMHVPGAP